MSYRDIRTLIDRGRKAGLGTSDLYRAMAGQPADGHLSPNHSDSNGYVPLVDERGQRVYRPLNCSPRS
jgi:hypothetical protein